MNINRVVDQLADKLAMLGNLIEDPGMEAAAEGWDPQVSATVGRVVSESHLGGASLEVITDGATGDEGTVYQPPEGRLEAEPDTTYHLRAYVKGDSGDVELVVTEHDAAVGGFLALQRGPIEALAGDWERLEFSFTTRSDTTHIRPGVLTGSGAQAITFFVDDVELRLTDGPALRVYGYTPPDIHPPAVIVPLPTDMTYHVTYGRRDQVTLPVTLIVGSVDDRAAHRNLADFMSGEGERSIRRLLDEATYSDDLAVRVQSAAAQWVAIGGADYLAARFTVAVGG